MDSPEDIARKFARHRPGYELVSYREVALPLFRCELSVVVAEEKPIPPVQEFVMRAVAEGFRRHEDIAGLLGLDAEIARDAAVQLMHNDEMTLAPINDGNGGHGLSLTSKGQGTVTALVQSTLSEIELSVYVDGLTREAVGLGWRKLGAFRASEAKQRGLPIVNAHPRRAPKLSEISDTELNAVLAEETRGRHLKRHVIGISELRRARRYARTGLALAFRSEESGKVQVSLLVDGAFSERHDDAFEAGLRYSSLRITDDDWLPIDTVVRQALPAEVVEQAAPAVETEELSERQHQAEEEQRDLRDAIQTAHDAEVEDLKRRLEEAEARERALAAKFDGLSVRHVPVFEHPEYLRKALRSSKERVLIISPWIRAKVVDDSLLRLFEETADRGVKVFIGYGITERPNEAKPNQADRDAERKLQNLARQYKSFHVHKLGDTHAKVLICDSSWAIVTSFNWLSFKGSRDLKFRDERGMYVGLPDKVNELFDEYSLRFQR